MRDVPARLCRFKLLLSDVKPVAEAHNAAVTAAAATGCFELGNISQALRELEEQQAAASNFTFVATYASLLRRCSRYGALDEGKQVHAHLSSRGYASNHVLCELLVQMYADCGCLASAQAVLQDMERRTVYAWNLVLQAHVKGGAARTALDLYHTMDAEPDKHTYAAVLSACSILGAVQEGKAVHARMIADLQLIPDSVLPQSLLITMYAKCRRLEDARSVFDAIKEKEVASWNSMIAAYAQQGQSREALDLFFHRMDVQPNAATICSALAACGDLGPEGLESGRKIHQKVVSEDLQAEVFVGNALLSMYANCSSNLKEAEEIFTTMQQKSSVSWSIMISAYIQHDRSLDALKLFFRMKQEGVQPKAYTVSCVLGACSNLGMLTVGVEIYSNSGYELDMSLQNTMIHLHSKCGSLEDAETMFYSMRSRNNVSWNAMISAYVQRGHKDEAFDLYHSLEEPNDFIFASILGACSVVEEVRAVHKKFSESRHRSDEIVHNALIRAYARCGSLELARRAFEEMPSRSDVSWNAMITSYVQHGRSSEALELYTSMKDSRSSGITFFSGIAACLAAGSLEAGRRIHEEVSSRGLETETGTGTALLNMYAKFGELDAARKIFDEIKEKSVVSWSAMVAAYAQNGKSHEAGMTFQAMQLEGAEPDDASFVCMLTAFSHGGLLEQGRLCFRSMELDFGVQRAIEHHLCVVDLLGRSGRLWDALQLVLDMPYEPTFSSWMTLLSGCKLQGDQALAEAVAQRIFDLDAAAAAASSAFILLASIRAPAQEEEARVGWKAFPSVQAPVVYREPWSSVVGAVSVEEVSSRCFVNNDCLERDGIGERKPCADGRR